jgi:hypothetical protein
MKSSVVSWLGPPGHGVDHRLARHRENRARVADRIGQRSLEQREALGFQLGGELHGVGGALAAFGSLGHGVGI